MHLQHKHSCLNGHFSHVSQACDTQAQVDGRQYWLVCHGLELASGLPRSVVKHERSLNEAFLLVVNEVSACFMLMNIFVVRCVQIVWLTLCFLIQHSIICRVLLLLLLHYS